MREFGLELFQFKELELYKLPEVKLCGDTLGANVIKTMLPLWSEVCVCV